MKSLKTALIIVFTTALFAYGYLYAASHGLQHLNLPGKDLLVKSENIFRKDLTFGVKLQTLPTKNVKAGFKTYIVFDQDRYSDAYKLAHSWFNSAVDLDDKGSITKIKAEIKLTEDAYKKINEAELLVLDGTPEQKLLMMEKELVVKLHDDLASLNNLLLIYGKL